MGFPNLGQGTAATKTAEPGLKTLGVGKKKKVNPLVARQALIGSMKGC